MVRIPSLSRRSEPAPTRDENLDGRVDGRDAPLTETGRSDDGVGRPVVTDRDANQTTDGSERRAGQRGRAAGQRAGGGGPSRHRATGGGRVPGRRPPDRTRARQRHDPSRRTRAPERRGPPGRTRARTAHTVGTEPRPAVAPTTARTAERDADLDSTTRRPDTTDRVTTERATTGRPVDPTPGTTTPEPPVTRGPKPRASLLATLGLIVSVAGALFVLTGTLAGYGIGLGAFACGALGVSA